MAVHGRKWPYALERRSAVGLLLLASALCARGAERLVEFPNIGALLAHARATQGDPAERIKVRGVVTYNHRGKSLFIQDQTGAVYAGCTKEQKVRVGDEVEVLGKLNRGGFSPIVVSASTVRIAQGALPLPAEMQLDAAVRGDYDMRLVSFVANVGACYDHGRTLTFTVITNGVPLNVELAKDGPGNPFSSVAMNSTVRLQGICSVKADFDRTIRSIMILMRSPADLTVLSPPPYWTARRVGIVTVAVVGIAAAALAWVYALRGQVRIKTAEIARLNEQLEQKVKARTTELETVNLELQAFTHSVSHDLKAPVRAIQNFSGLLSSEHSTGMSSAGMQFVKRIQHNADNMGKLISAVLSFSRISQCELRHELVDMKEVVQAALLELSHERESRSIEFQVEDLPRVHGDSTLLKQAMSNLISNAIKYTRKRDVARIEIGCLTDRHEVTFFVRDNGVGFASEHASKLFQPFERLHRAREYEGCGVGLAIAYRIISRHGGRMWAEAECDKGATFYLALPKAESDSSGNPGRDGGLEESQVRVA